MTADGAQRQAQRAGWDVTPMPATRCDASAGATDGNSPRKALRIAEMSNAPQDNARRCEDTPCRTRTCDPLIKSQLLYQLS